MMWLGRRGLLLMPKERHTYIHPKLPLKQMSIFAHGKLTLFMEKEKISQAFISDHMTVFINGFI